MTPAEFKAAIREAGLTQAEAAVELDLTHRQVSRKANGHSPILPGDEEWARTRLARARALANAQKIAGDAFDAAAKVPAFRRVPGRRRVRVEPEPEV